MEANKGNSSIDWVKNFQIGLLASVLTQPFEVLRTSSISEYKNTKGIIGMKRLWMLIKSIKNKEGWRGFFRGSWLSILKNTIGCTIFFTGIRNFDNKFKQSIPKQWRYENPKRVYEHIIKGSLDFVNASVSKVLTTVIVSPILIIKTRFQVVGKVKNSIWKESKIIYKNSGLRGFYKGLLPTLLRDGSLAGFQFAIYSWLMNKILFLQNNKQQWIKNMTVSIVGGLSTVMAVFLTFPFDNIRVRLQIEDSAHKNIIDLIKFTVFNEGVLGLYKGIVPRMLKKGFSGSLLWLIYENVWNEEQKRVMAS